MASTNPELIAALERTILKLKQGAAYQWGHMGACNCGNLAQELTQLSKAEIHSYAMQRHGDWNEQILDYCPSSGYPMDLMISKMLSFGLTLKDLAHLEKLSDPEILAGIPSSMGRHLNKNSKEDVIAYMSAWSKILREQWFEKSGELIKIENPKKKSLALLR